MPQILSQRRSGATKYYHADALGSTRLLTDSSQVVSDSYINEAFGKVVASSGSTTNPLKYVGLQNYYDDGSSGQLLLGVRYYDPKTGRFVSVDPEKEGVNWYGYVENSPSVNVDPEGLHGGTGSHEYPKGTLGCIKLTPSDVTDLRGILGDNPNITLTVCYPKQGK